ncbi:SDR family oxidoreductase [Alteromonas lipotrueiana]|uniref:SDR family oxidoreductase n=1 Tax=Alteromonas lipotrueiana TaxID=2803815 RepID=UPI001C462BCB|nr:SDR family oxidoreductase [Alteromonas lipotrueiana]
MTPTSILNNKVAIVTGGAKGLGLTLTESLLAEGMQVAICGREAAALEKEGRQLIADYPNQLFWQACDVSQAEEVDAFIDAVKRRFNSIDVLINNSGFGKQTLVWETSETDWNDVMDTNVKGPFLLARKVVPVMIAQQSGYIVNIASQAALNGYANAGVYCASKFAMVGLAKALQEEVRQYNIHVHSLNPALIQSHRGSDEAIDEGLVQNEDIASTLLFLLKQPRRLKIDNIGMWGF